MNTLERIVDAHRAADAARPRARGFAHALRQPGLSVVAEITRRSPSKGDLAPGLDPAVMAKNYVEGGAACLSVLTDEEFFGGSVADLQTAREAVDVPVLRKDFTVSQLDVCDARLMGADAILLIVAALTDPELAGLHDLALDLGMDALVEVHDHGELHRALAVGATLIGVNQRNLKTFEIDRDIAPRLAEDMPSNVLKVAESGIRGAADAEALLGYGFDAILVGETLVTATDPVAAVRELRCS